MIMAFASVSITFAQSVPIAVGQNIGALGKGTGISPEPAGYRAFNIATPSESIYDIYIYAEPMPLKANANWQVAARAAVQELYTNKFLVNDIGVELFTSYITQDSSGAGKSLWYPVRIVGKKGVKLNGRMTHYTQRSSDDANSLANAYSLLGGNFDYSLEFIGIIRDTGGERVNDQILTSGSADVMVDEIIFSGLQGTYFPYKDQAEYASIDAYVKAKIKTLITTVDMVSTNGTILASASRTLVVGNNILAQPVLSIRMVGNNYAISIFTGNRWTTSVLEERNPNSTNGWFTVSTANDGDEIIRPMTFPNRIFRARLE